MAKRDDQLKKIINKQKKIIQTLKKEAGLGNKQKRRFEALEEELMEQLLEEEDTEKNDATCPSCQKGNLELVDLKVRKMFICDTCDFRKIKK